MERGHPIENATSFTAALVGDGARGVDRRRRHGSAARLDGGADRPRSAK